MNKKVFEILKSTSKKHPLTAKEIANNLKISTYKVRKAIYSLRRQGVKIKASSKGYYLPSRKDKMPTTVIHKGPYRIVIRDSDGKKIKDVQILDQTNDVKGFTVLMELLNGTVRKL